MAKKEKRDPLLLRFVNLNPDDDCAIKDFVNSIELTDAYLEFFGHTVRPEPKAERFSAAKIKNWHKEFMHFFRRWTDTKQLTQSNVEWINDRLPRWRKKLIFLLDAEDKIDEDTTKRNYIVAYVPDDPILLMSYILDQLVTLLADNKEIRQCAAEDCQKYFLPTPRGRNQEYCSKQCYERIRSRKRRAKKK